MPQYPIEVRVNGQQLFARRYEVDLLNDLIRGIEREIDSTDALQQLFYGVELPQHELACELF